MYVIENWAKTSGEMNEDVWREILKKVDIVTVSRHSQVSRTLKSLAREMGVNRQIRFDSPVSQTQIALLLRTFGAGCRALRFAPSQKLEFSTLQSVKTQLVNVEKVGFQWAELEQKIYNELPDLFPSLTTVSFKHNFKNSRILAYYDSEDEGCLTGLVNSTKIRNIETRRIYSDPDRLLRMTQRLPVGQF